MLLKNYVYNIYVGISDMYSEISLKNVRKLVIQTYISYMLVISDISLFHNEIFL